MGLRVMVRREGEKGPVVVGHRLCSIEFSHKT